VRPPAAWMKLLLASAAQFVESVYESLVVLVARALLLAAQMVVSKPQLLKRFAHSGNSRDQPFS
jgi:hypothetical protein